MRLEKGFFNRSAGEVAKELLGKILVRRFGSKLLKAKIVETEAYFGESDPASRAVQNGDLRKTMLMVPGTILVYGVHNNWLLNFVTKEEGKAEAVLIRALEPLNFDLNTKGPGLLTKAMKVDKKFHKENAFDSEELWLEENNNVFEIGEDFRIGIKRDLPDKFRFYIKENKHVSRK